jgi:hypothetical protein
MLASGFDDAAGACIDNGCDPAGLRIEGIHSRHDTIPFFADLPQFTERKE